MRTPEQLRALIERARGSAHHYEQQIGRALPHHDTEWLTQRRDAALATACELQRELEGSVASSWPLVIIPCGGKKRSVQTFAGRMYVGSYHRACRAAADAITTTSMIRILSGLYGLLALEEMIDPYEQRIDAPGGATVNLIRSQAVATGLLDVERVVVLAGQAYAKRAVAVWPNAELPFAGTKGMGAQLAILRRMSHPIHA